MKQIFEVQLHFELRYPEKCSEWPKDQVKRTEEEAPIC